MSKAPNELKYAESHEWLRLEADGTVTVGITDHAQEALGDLVFVELPQVGSEVDAGQQVAVVESVKAAADVYAPIGGKILAVNDAVVDAPESVNQDAYSAWLFKMAPSDLAECDVLLSADAYLAVADA